MSGNISSRVKQQEKNRQNYQGYSGPFEGRVENIGPFRDTMVVSYGPTEGREMPIQHPFVGSTSWIRSTPDVGTKYLLQLRGDSEQATPLNTLPINSETRSVLYNQQYNLYRGMSAGEHDILSKGFGALYLGEMGHVDTRSGVGARAHLNKLSLEHQVHTATHRKTMIFNVAGQLNDEERIGVVKRWQDAIDEKYIRAGEAFQAEKFTRLMNPAGENPTVLFQEIEGQVYDDVGTRVNHTLSNVPLRYQKLRYTNNNQVHRTEVDESGNTLIQHPDVATEGFQHDIPKGNYRKNVGLNREISIGKDEFVTVKEDIQYTVGGTVKYSVTKETVIDSSSNILELNPAVGKEKASLLNKQGYGIVAQNADDSGFTTVTGPKSSFITLNGKGEIIASSGNAETLKLTQGLVELVSSATVRIKGQTLNVDANKIYLGEGAAIPAVMGLSLQMYIDTHTHPFPAVEMPPKIPSASFTGTPQSILSTNVYLKPNI